MVLSKGLNEPKRFDERTLMEQIEYLFDTSSDKKLLLQDCLKAIDDKKQKISKFRGCDDPTTYGLLYGDGIGDTLEFVKNVLGAKTQETE